MDTPAPPPASAEEEDDLNEGEEYEDDDEEGDDEDDVPARETDVSARRIAELLGIGVLCMVLGGMLAGAALGVVVAMRAHPVRSAMTASLAARPVARSAAATPDASAPVDAAVQQEADPEESGDGVMDELDDGPAEPPPTSTANATPTPAPSRPAVVRAAVTPPTVVPVPTPTRTRRIITSDDVPEGPAQGYVHGRAVRIVVTRLDGKPVEQHTAAAYRRLHEAAARDHVAIRIVSGFRTMEHQQALYRAYRQGRGNLAALPGHSNHQSGHALDLNTSSPGVFRWLTRNGRRFGFRRTVPTEPWHWEWW